jgi:hypothetical protein
MEQHPRHPANEELCYDTFFSTLFGATLKKKNSRNEEHLAGKYLAEMTRRSSGCSMATSSMAYSPTCNFILIVGDIYETI